MAREFLSDGHEPFESIHGLLLLEVAMYFCPRTSLYICSVRCTFIPQPTFAPLYRWRAIVFFGKTMKNLMPAYSVDTIVPVEDMLGEGRCIG